MNASKNLLDRSAAESLLFSLSDEFALVRNPEYVYPPFEIYPLPPKKDLLDRGMAAAVMDMDGTTTTTEALCLHSLETMVRRAIGAEDKAGWPGLDREKDYPNVIGNSTTKHVEYLMRVYGDRFDPEFFTSRLYFALAWNYANRPERRVETRATAAALGLEPLLQFEIPAEGSFDSADTEMFLGRVRQFADGGRLRTRLEDPSLRVRAAIEVYYQEYHSILMGIGEGKSAGISLHLFGTPDRRLIEPMKGIGYFLALIEGLLGEEAELGFETLLEHLLSLGYPAQEIIEGQSRLRDMGAYFARNPALVGLVTSSIEYEAGIVLSEVFSVLQKEVADWPVGERTRDRVTARFADYRQTYAAVVTATDSCEIRLKPHRDLYSLALSRLGIGPGDFDRVIGFEDSESGSLAMRAAGIPLGVALPFPETTGHSFETSSYVAHGGLPEVILLKNCFLPLTLLREGV